MRTRKELPGQEPVLKNWLLDLLMITASSSVILLMLVAIFNDSVSVNTGQNEAERLGLPREATEIVERGGGWIEFSLDGRQFLFCRINRGACLTELSKQAD